MVAARALPERRPGVAAHRERGRADDQPLWSRSRRRLALLHARVWRVEVGRTMLLLLDSNVPENSESDRSLTARLYGGDARVRIRQELLLGVGGVRALQCASDSSVGLHLNEGHQRVRDAGDDPLDDGDAGCPSARYARSLGHDRLYDAHAGGRRSRPLSRPLVEEHLGKIREALHLSYEDFMGLGRVYPADTNELFCMTVLALKLSRYANGVRRCTAWSLDGCGNHSSSTRPRKTSRSVTSRTGFTCRAGSPPDAPGL